MTTPIELLPGLNLGLLVVTMKLQTAGAMNSQLQIKVSRGAATQLIGAWRATTGTGFITNIVTLSQLNPAAQNTIYTTAVPFVFDGVLIPQAGTTELGSVQIQLRKFNPRGNVNGQGNGYFDGLLHCSLKQYKDCP